MGEEAERREANFRKSARGFLQHRKTQRQLQGQRSQELWPSVQPASGEPASQWVKLGWRGWRFEFSQANGASLPGEGLVGAAWSPQADGSSA